MSNLINSLETIHMSPNKILVEYFDKNEEISYGRLRLKILPYNYSSSDSTSTGRGRHLERSGKVIKVCDQLRTHQNFINGRDPKRRKVYDPQTKKYFYKTGKSSKRTWNWETQIEIEEEQWVWFASSSFDNAEKFSIDGRNFMILDYHQLYMSEERLLNGYLLCEKVEKEPESKILHTPVKKQHTNIYKIYQKASPVKYLDYYEDIPGYVQPGDFIITRFHMYPLLEESGHYFFSDKELHIFQSKEVIFKL